MKNKKLTYVLLIFVLIVWGIIIFKILDVSTDQVTEIKKDPFIPQVNDDIMQDTFSLQLNYKDPFLKNYAERRIPSITPNNKLNKNKNIKPLPEKKEPKIEYLGLIKNKNSNNTLALLKINSHEVIVNTKNKTDSIQVLFINNDSIAFKYSKIIYKIAKAKSTNKKS